MMIKRKKDRGAINFPLNTAKVQCSHEFARVPSVYEHKNRSSQEKINKSKKIQLSFTLSADQSTLMAINIQ